MNKSVLNRLESIDDLPTIPLVIQKIEEAIRDEDTSAKKVASVIQDDPAIMARILKIVNSVYYRSADGKEINSLSLAIARLGFTAIKNIALSSSVFTAFSEKKVTSFDLNQFWVHCIGTGIINNIVYETCGGNLTRIYTKDELHLLGLLHDIGKIILEHYFHEEYTGILEYGRENKVHSVIAEEAVLGVNHAQIGAWLAKKWKLPPLYVSGILFHHNTQSAPAEFLDAVTITNISDFICLKGRVGYSGTAALPEFSGSVWKHLGLNNKMLADILDRSNEEAKNSAVMLGLMTT